VLEMPNTPVKPPPVETLRPFEANENAPEELPMVVDVPDVEDKVTLPDWFKLPESVVVPVTPRVPPIVALPFEASVLNVPAAGVIPPIAMLLIVPPVRVAPDEAKVLAVVGPFRETVPVPVEKVVAPLCARLVTKFKLFPLVSKVTKAEPPALVNLNALAESDCGVNVALGALPSKVNFVAPVEDVEAIH
jgi:hypothetical protein